MNYQVILPATWKDGLVNNDWITLESNFPDDAASAKAWQIEAGLTVIGCEEKAFIAAYEGIETLCLRYLCTDPAGDDEFDRVLKRIEQGSSTVNDARFIRHYVTSIRQGAIVGAHRP